MKNKRRLYIAGIVIGCLLMMSPVFGMISTVLGMRGAFASLGSSGIGDPQALSDHIGTTLISTAVGIALVPVGLISFIISLVLFCRMPPENKLQGPTP